MKSGIKLIAKERKRQIEVEGWSLRHDATHDKGELLQAAMCYARPESKRKYKKQFNGPAWLSGWPWPSGFWKPTPNDRIRELVKAGALIAAEIDRLQNIEK